MTRQQIFLLISTFVVGMVAGAYMYITGFAPNYDNNIPQDESNRGGALSIRGEQFGGCEMVGVCASFELTANRKYRYIREHHLDEETPVAMTGTVSRATFTELEEVLNNTDLMELKVPGNNCNAAVDGIDYRYDIVVDGVSYELNSCGTEFYGSRLYNELLKLWGEMIKTETKEVEELSLRALLIDWFPQSS